MTSTVTAAEQNIQRATPRQVRGYIKDCLYAGVVPFIQSSPGMGKSSIVKSVFEELGLKTIDHRLSTSAPEDLTGLPHFDKNGMARFSPFADLFPIAGTDIPAGYDGWGIFLDEFNSAPKSVQAASYKLILDRQTGQFDLHENVAMVLAGNLMSDKAITNALSTAMQSRVIHIEMMVSHREWLEDVAFAENYDERIIAFLNYKESYLMNFNPDHNEKTFCCPRTWEFMNRLIKDKPVRDDKIALYGGTITYGVALEFVQFTKIFDSLITIQQILSDPEKAAVPSDNATKWAIISHLMDKVSEDNFSDLSTYVDRFDMTFRVLFYRSIIVRQPKLRAHPAFTKASVSLTKYLSS